MRRLCLACSRHWSEYLANRIRSFSDGRAESKSYPEQGCEKQKEKNLLFESYIELYFGYLYIIIFALDTDTECLLQHNVVIWTILSRCS